MELLKICKKVFFACVAFTFIFSAQARQIDTLSYPAELNSIWVLPQRFEYGILGPDQFHLGPVMINLAEMKYKLHGGRGNFQWDLQWPTGFFDQGQMVIKDSTQRTLWTHDLKTQRLQKTSKQIKISDDMPPLTAQLTKYDFSFTDEVLAETLKGESQFFVCLRIQEVASKIELCSRPLSLKQSENGEFRLSELPGSGVSYVDIEGKRVTKTGIFFVESGSEPMNFRATARSGVRFNLIVVKRAVDFTNLTALPEQKKLRVTATGIKNGSKPFDGSKITGSDENTWTAEVDLDRPRLYLRGEAGVPFQQEFFVRKNITTYPEIRIQGGAQDSGYYSNMRLQLEGPADMNLQAGANSEVEKTGPGKWQWSLRNMDDGENQRTLGVTRREQNFKSIFRYQKYSRQSLNLSGEVEAGYSLDFHYYYNNLFGALIKMGSMARKNLEDSLMQSAVFMSIQMNDNLLREGPVWTALLGAQNLAQPDFNTSSFSLGFKYDGPSPNSMFGERWDLLYLLPLVPFESTKKVQGIGSLQFLMKWAMTKNSYIDVGFSYRGYQLKVDESSTNYTNLAVLAGLGFYF